MKIALLSGAIKNAGDYLIVDRSKSLIEHVYPDAIIKTYIRNYSLEEQLNETNNNDVAIIAGGPSYHKNLYPQNIPLIKELDSLKTKLFILGAGWYGNTISEKEIWNYRFKESSLQLLRRVENDSKFWGCRDYYAVKVLAANGFKQTLMTGCPA